MQGSGYAGASGQHTHTSVKKTAGGGVVATSFSSSTGQGPQQHEASVLHTTTGKLLPRVCWAGRRGGGADKTAEASGRVCLPDSPAQATCSLVGLHSPADPTTMTTHELKLWLQARSQALLGASPGARSDGGCRRMPAPLTAQCSFHIVPPPAGPAAQGRRRARRAGAQGSRGDGPSPDAGPVGRPARGQQAEPARAVGKGRQQRPGVASSLELTGSRPEGQGAAACALLFEGTCMRRKGHANMTKQNARIERNTSRGYRQRGYKGAGQQGGSCGSKQEV